MQVEERSEEVINKRTQEFANRLLNLQKEKKNIDLDIKELKEEYKLDGVDVTKAVKALNTIKKKMKQSVLDAQDEQNMEDMLAECEDVVLNLNELIAG